MSPLGEGRPSRFPGVDRAVLFFFHDPATPEIYTLSLHDALPILRDERARRRRERAGEHDLRDLEGIAARAPPVIRDDQIAGRGQRQSRLLDGDEEEERDVLVRSEEHTSELQSRFDLVCRLLLEKK